MLETRCLMAAWTVGLGDPTPSDPGSLGNSPQREFQPLINSRTNLVPAAVDHYSETMPGPRDARASGASAGSGDEVLSPGGPSPLDAPYVVVNETSSPHQTFGSAQKLPDLSYFGVVGTIGNRDGVDLYQLTLATGASRLDFSLVSNQAGPSVPVVLDLFDASGRALGVWTSGGQGSADLHAELSNLPAGTTLYLGVSAGNTSGSGPTVQAANYQLWIDHEPGGGRSTSADTSSGSSGNTTGMMPVTGSANGASTGGGPLSSAVAGQSNVSSTQNADGVGLVAVGSAAMRSARPSGGLLADIDPTPPAARDFNVAVNKEWEERSTSGPKPVDLSESQPAVLAASANEPDALVVIHGPGGFPLVGALAIGHRHKAPATEVGDFATGPAIGEPGPPVAEIGSGILIARSNSPLAETRDTTLIEAIGSRELTEYPVTVYSGLGLATVLTLNALFSQPMAGYDYLPSRLDADARSQSDCKYRRRNGGAAH